jgi:hypothetical protein
MHKPKRGRWVVRIACAVAVGAAVLSLPAAAIAVVDQQKPSTTTWSGIVDGALAVIDPIYVANDVVWG